MYQIAPFKNSRGGMPPNPPVKARRGCIFLPNIIPPMFEHGFTPLVPNHKIYKEWQYNEEVG